LFLQKKHTKKKRKYGEDLTKNKSQVSCPEQLEISRKLEKSINFPLQKSSVQKKKTRVFPATGTGLVGRFAAMTASHLLSRHCHTEIDQLHLEMMPESPVGMLEWSNGAVPYNCNVI
jgi:hypothetical protein